MMPARAPYPSEKIVGRRMPPKPRNIDVLMSGFVKADGTFTSSMNPSESWLKPAHLKARRMGWIRSCRFVIKFVGERGAGMSLWELTDAGKTEAVQAKARRDAAEDARAQWCRDFDRAYRASTRERKERGES